MEDSGGNPIQEERRRASRASTLRHAFFSMLAGTGASSRGTVTDISPEGLCIRTARPVPEGCDIEIEVFPRPDAAGKANTRDGSPLPDAPVFRVRGHVVRLDPLGERQYALGVRLDPMHLTPPVHGLQAAGRETPGQSAADSRMGPGAGPEPDPDTAQPVRFYPLHQHPEPGRRRRRWWLLLLLFLLLLLTALLLVYGTGLRDEIARQWDGRGAVSSDRGEDAPLPSGYPAVYAALPPAALQYYGSRLLARGRPEEAEQLFDFILSEPAFSPLDRYLARMGRAESALIAGGRRQAQLRAGLALEEAEGVPAPWLEYGRAFREALFQESSSPQFLRKLTPVLHLREAEEENVPEIPGPMRLEISLSKYRLTVYRGEEILHEFPVGLGRDGATPLGDFHIANKITDPDWYNRGESVPAGDPENPLGRRWLGLGDDKGPTPVGIHPTEEAASIGADCSRGCIRMRPEDAETLFDLCGIGTPVRIVP
jgi:hypothetical protein